MSDVFFVGCGPGDPELLTMRAYNVLTQGADIVVYDRLVEESVINLLLSKILFFDEEANKKYILPRIKMAIVAINQFSINKATNKKNEIIAPVNKSNKLFNALTVLSSCITREETTLAVLFCK